MTGRPALDDLVAEEGEDPSPREQRPRVAVPVDPRRATRIREGPGGLGAQTPQLTERQRFVPEKQHGRPEHVAGGRSRELAEALKVGERAARPVEHELPQLGLRPEGREPARRRRRLEPRRLGAARHAPAAAGARQAGPGG